jgi:ribosomal-protein-alanine N-acetyltransferase
MTAGAPPGDGFDLVRLTEADLPQVMALERLCYSQPWTEENFRAEFRRRVTLPLGLKRGKALAGQCFFWLFPPDLHLLNLAVTPACRRLGLGRRLLAAMMTLGRRAGAAKVYLEVRPTNEAALTLYRDFGFQLDYRRPNYYENGEDAFLMTAPLADEPTAKQP